MQTTFCIANKTIKSTSGIEKLQEMSHIAYIKVKMNDNEDQLQNTVKVIVNY